MKERLQAILQTAEVVKHDLELVDERWVEGSSKGGERGEVLVGHVERSFECAFGTGGGALVVWLESNQTRWEKSEA